MGCNCGAKFTIPHRKVVETTTDTDSRLAVIQFRYSVTVNEQSFLPSERVSLDYGSIIAVITYYNDALYFINNFDRQVFLMSFPQFTGFAL